MCNTFSEVRHDNIPAAKTTPRISFWPKPMLDDPAAGCRNALLHSLGSTVSGRGGLLQQLYPKRRLVHPSFHSSLRKKRVMVLSRYRFLPCGELDQDPHCAGHREPGRHERRDVRGDTPVPLPWGPGESLAQRQYPARENRATPGLFCCRFAQGREAATSAVCTTSAQGSVFCRDGCPGAIGVYPQSRFKLRAIGRKDLPKQKGDRTSGTNRTSFRPTRAKKNDADCGARALEALGCVLKQLSMDTSPGTLFPEPPVIRFTPQEKECSCGTRLLVQKTRQKKVFKMTGPLIAHETVRQCPACGKVFGSHTLLQLAPARSNVAYDVMIFVGRAMYQRHKTTEEIRAELAVRNVFLSLSEINYLGRKFILYLARAHRQAIPRIRETMSTAGGYMLHLDATHAGDAPALMTGLDSLSKIVLANIKIPSEHTGSYHPLFKRY